MDQVIKRLKTKRDGLKAEMECLFADLGKAYHQHGSETYGDKPNATAKVKTKIRNLETEIRKVQEAIDQVELLDRTVA